MYILFVEEGATKAEVLWVVRPLSRKFGCIPSTKTCYTFESLHSQWTVAFILSFNSYLHFLEHDAGYNGIGAGRNLMSCSRKQVLLKILDLVCPIVQTNNVTLRIITIKLANRISKNNIILIPNIWAHGSGTRKVQTRMLVSILLEPMEYVSNSILLPPISSMKSIG